MQLPVIQRKIYEVRELKVMLDFDLAELYEVETRALNQAVRRNADIFPEDFVFQLSLAEWEIMSSHFVMTYPAKRPKTALPLAFTEYGVTMLDFDLAELYETETKYLKRAVRANIKRFPADFMFELSKEERETLRCKNYTSKFPTSKNRGCTRY